MISSLTMRLLAIYFSFLILPSLATAAIKNVTISGASATEVTTVGTNTTYTIYAGTAGNDSSCVSKDNVNPCDSCSALGTSLAPCNSARIYPTLKLRIEFETDSSAIANGSSVIYYLNDSDALTPDGSYSTGLTPNTPLHAEISWEKLCSSLVSSATCSVDTSTAKTVTFGIDTDGNTDKLEEFIKLKIFIKGSYTSGKTYHTDNCTEALLSYEGFCNFNVFRGDNKAYLTQPVYADTYPSTGANIEYKYVRFYYIESNLGSADNTEFFNIGLNANYVNVSTEKSGSTFYLQSNKIAPLTNGKRYYVLMANVDEAGNVFYFSNPGSLDHSTHSSIPEPVLGLLDGQECFIATAAFGSSLAPEVDTFRKFRNMYLLSWSGGQKLVKAYYQVSPKFADVIARSEALRFMARLALWPLLFLIQLALLSPWLAISFFTLSLLAFALKVAVTRHRQGRFYNA